MAVNHMGKRWLISLMFLVTSAAAGEDELERRVRILEQRLSSQALMEMMQQVGQLQREVQTLRGQVETLENTLRQLREGQKRQYLDLEGRLRRLEGGNAPSPEVSSGAPLIESPSMTDSSKPEGSAGEYQPKAVESVQPEVGLTPPSDQAKQAYRKAYNKLQAGHFDAAITAFTQFLQQYPRTTLSANAYYWLGEAYYVKRDFNAALESFRQVVEHFPSSLKVPDALLKMGFVAYEQGRWRKARSLLEDVIRRFPDTHAARLAKDRLQRMKQEGRT